MTLLGAVAVITGSIVSPVRLRVDFSASRSDPASASEER